MGSSDSEMTICNSAVSTPSSEDAHELTSGPVLRGAIQAHVPKRSSKHVCDAEVGSVMASYHGDREDQRRWERTPFPHTVVLAPIDAESNEVAGPPMMVQGSDISLAGISFYHTAALPSRHVIAGLKDAFGATRSFVIVLTWTRRTDDGRYQSGGRFVRPVAAGVVNEAMQSGGETA